MQQFYTDLTFEEWILFTFDHAAEGPVWYHAFDGDVWDGSSETTVDYLLRLFHDPVPALADHSDDQIGQGFWYLVGNGGGDYLRPLFDPKVPLDRRLSVLDAIPILFEKLFLPRCGDHLAHLDRTYTPPLNGALYMWWDIAPLGGYRDDDEELTALNAHCLAAMEAALEFESDACRESSLHGLGHWRYTHPERAREIIDRFLQRHRERLRPELERYAVSARDGCIQ